MPDLDRLAAAEQVCGDLPKTREYNRNCGNDVDNFAHAEFEQGRSYLRDNFASPMRDELLAALAERDAMLRLAVVDRIHDGERSPDGIETCDCCVAYLADLSRRVQEAQHGK